MTASRVEHVNLTVSDPIATARMLVAVFGWRIRWEGDAIDCGKTVHVGDETTYLALYRRPGVLHEPQRSYDVKTGLNHIGIVVDDLDAVEARVKSAGYSSRSHADYEPGRRFYFEDGDGLEIEVVSYADE